jgi:hypothetical protein
VSTGTPQDRDRDRDRGAQLRGQGDRAYKEAVRLDTGPAGVSNSAAEALYLQAAEALMQASKLSAAAPSSSSSSSSSQTTQQQQQQALTATVSSILDRVSQLRGSSQGRTAAAAAPVTSAEEEEEDMFLQEFEQLLPPSIDPSRPLLPRPGAAPPPSANNNSDSSSGSGSSSNTNSSGSSGSSGGSSSSRPQSSGDLSSAEISILRRSSFINGRCFLPWMNDESTEQFHFPRGQRFTDPDGFLPLSASQLGKQARYKRIHEIVAAAGGGAPVLIKAVSPLAITQVSRCARGEGARLPRLLPSLSLACPRLIILILIISP